MPEPYDYSRAMPKMPDPFGSYARGADLGYGIQQRELQTQQQELEIQQQQVELANQRAAAKRRIDMQDAIAGLMNNKSPSAIMHVMTEYPEIIQNLKPLFDEYTTQELQQKISTATPIYAALLNNRPDLAAEIYEKQAIAAENSGDNERAAIARAKAEQVVKFPNVAMTELGITMATAMGKRRTW
jgi:2-oxo-4-hydroxy-4-carboxy--5-ureidoimidazoline (OHCU) decarboxylase